MGGRIHDAVFHGKLEGLKDQELMIAEAALEVEGRVVQQWSGGQSCEIHKNLRLWAYDPFTGEHSNSGEIDKLWVLGERALIGDLKSLYGEVAESSRNMQLRDCASLVYLNGGMFQVEEVTVFINQPLVTRNPLLTTYTQDDLIKSCLAMRRRVERSLDPSSPRKAGEVQCKHCRAKPTCPEAISEMRSLTVQPRSWNLLAPEEKLDLWDKCKMAEMVIKAIRSKVRADLEQDPQAVPGLALTEGKSVREMRDLIGLYERLVLSHNFSPDMFIEQCGLAVGDAKKIFAAIHPTVAKKDLDDRFNQEWEAFIQFKINQPTIERIDGFIPRLDSSAAPRERAVGDSHYSTVPPSPESQPVQGTCSGGDQPTAGSQLADVG